MQKYYDMGSYATQYMAQGMARYNLSLVNNTGATAWLGNDHCMLQLENIDNDYVRFDFYAPSSPEVKWGLVEYLHCRFDGRGRELRPLPPAEYGAEAKFVFFLQTYDRLLSEGYLDAPMQGDYGWQGDYAAMLAEERELSVARLRLAKAGHPEAAAILAKQAIGDRSWITDMRRILAG